MLLKNIIQFAFIFFTFVSFSNAQDFKTGSYRVKSTPRIIMGDAIDSANANIVQPDTEITWSLFVPENYDPTKPAGVLLYQSNRDPNNEPIGWKSVMEERNMILLIIYNSGEQEPREIMMTVFGLSLVQDMYKINTNRIYITGYVGCAVAGLTSKIYANIVKGAIYYNCIPSTWIDEEPPLIDDMRQNRYVFYHGKDAMTKTGLKQAERKYNKSGIENTKFKALNRLRDKENLKRRDLLKAIKYLDGEE